ncbi:MFS transporter [Paenibacillus tarimensis]
MSTLPADGKQKGLFTNRIFLVVVLSNLLLQTGIWVRNYAILWFVSEKTGNDEVAISLTLVVEYAPIFLFSFIGGTFADRWRPKLTMIWSDFLSALSVFIVLFALAYGSWTIIYFVTFVSAILSQFSQPSAMKLFKQHIPENQLQQAMGVFQSIAAIFLVGGPALGIFVYNQYGIYTSIAIMGVMFLLSALVLVRLPSDPKEEQAENKPEADFRRELADGFRYVWRSRVLKTMGGTFLIAGLAVGLAQAVGILIAVDRLGQPKEFMQFMMMVNGVAMLIGGGVIVGLSKRIPSQALLALGMLIAAVTTIGVGWSTSVTLTLALQFIGGLSFPAIHIGASTTILKWTETPFIGRVNGVLNPMFVGGMVLMAAVSGVLVKLTSLVTVYTISGILLLAGVLLLVPVFKLKPEISKSPGEETASAPLTSH